MGLPKRLVLVRHGESEGNRALAASRRGDQSLFTDLFRQISSAYWELTPRGIEQAEASGQWLREHGLGRFDRRYVSSHVRAMQTAGHLNVEGRNWFTDDYLRERERGATDLLTRPELAEQHAETLTRRDQHPLYWRPPEGESMADLCLRVDRVLDTLHRECDGQNVILVCHGEVMLAFQMRIERWTAAAFVQNHESKHPHDQIHNGQIIEYSRRQDPERDSVQDMTVSGIKWKRSVCPTDPSLSTNEWEEIIRPSWTNQQLLKEAKEHVSMAHRGATARLLSKT